MILKLSFSSRGLGQRRSGQQLQYVISGDTYENIIENINIILDELKQNKNFLFSRIDYKKNRPQIKINLNKDKANDLNISNFEIGRTLEILLAGRKINTFIENGEEYYVIVQAKKQNRENFRDIGAFEVKSLDGNYVRLDNIIEYKEVNEAKELNRYNKMRSITLSAGLGKGYSLGDAITFLEKISKENLKETLKSILKDRAKNTKIYESILFSFYCLINFCLLGFMCTI